MEGNIISAYDFEVSFTLLQKIVGYGISRHRLSIIDIEFLIIYI